MINLRRLNKWTLAMLLAVPTVTLSATLYGALSDAKRNSSLIHTRNETNDPMASVVLQDNFENNAEGWTLVNSSVNKWYAGFPQEFLSEGEAAQGLYLSDTPGGFTYSFGAAAVSHAHKTFQLPAGIEEITLSFDWISEGYADTNWVTLESVPMDYMRVWLVPSSFIPVADQPISVESSGGFTINNGQYVENGRLRHETKTVQLGALMGQEVKLIFEWTNGAIGWPTKPAAVRNLKIEAVACPTITTLPFTEDFSSLSRTRSCWTIVNNNNDFRLWKFATDFVYNEITETNTQIEAAVIHTNGARGNNDDWLMTPPIRLTGNQRLRYTYRVQSEDLPNEFRVVLSRNGTAINNFTTVLVPTTAYSHTQYRESVVDLVDANGEGISGEVTIAWHVPPGQLNGWALAVSQVTVEDIPLCPIPLGVNVVSNEVHWSTEGTETQWEVVVQAPRSGRPTGGGVLVSQPQYTMENLAVSTDYEVYVRAKCQVNGVDEAVYSPWAGPVQFRSPMVVASLPYEENFENQPVFEFSNDTRNHWMIGSAPHNGRNQALHITNGNDNYQYTLNEKQTSHVYKDIFIPAGGQELLVQMDWKNVGEEKKDFFKVWLVPTNYVPTSGVKVNALATSGIQLDANSFYLSPDFKQIRLYAPVAAFANQPMRLLFEWQNDSSRGVQPPAAIDNLYVNVMHCARPTAIEVSAITQTTAQMSWTNAPDVTTYDLYVSTENARPSDTVTPTYSGVTSPFVLTNLTPNTRYYVWVRSACSSTQKSFWQDAIDFASLQNPGVLPLTDDFENNKQWTTTLTAKNKWEVGGATGNASRQSLYVSSDLGLRNHYEITQASVSHAYRDILVPEDALELRIEYDYQVQGELSRNNPKDYFRLVKVPLTANLSEGTPIQLSEENVVIGRPYYAKSEGWKKAIAILDVSENRGEVIRLVFEWVNNASNGEQSPAAIDNFKVSVPTCLSARNPKAELVRYTSNIRLSWEAQQEETQWEVYIAEQGTPEPTATTTGIVVNEPTLLLENVEAGRYYVYYVRTICLDENGERQSVWVGPTKYSYFVPDSCADLQGGIEGIPPSESNQYIICEDGPVKRKLEANYFDVKTTDSYRVEAIDYNPPFPFYGGDMIDLTRDDYWSNTINLGFDFCFFGKTYDKILITTNGAITFSIAGEVEGGRYAPEAHSPWSFWQPIPFQPTNTEAPFVNAIFGVMQDLDPNYSPEDYSINYQILGTFPCRALVFNIYHLGLFGRHHNPDDVEGSTQTSQIVLFEGTNVIEVHVKNRPVAQDFGSTHNRSSGLIGIQNEDGTRAHFPGEEGGVNRNTGSWNASNEAWRFVPNGESTVNFNWYRDGAFFSKDQEIEVTVTESVNYTARAVYQSCQGKELVVERIFNFVKDDFEVPELEDQLICSTIENVNRPIRVNIADKRQTILTSLDGGINNRYTVDFYADADFITPLSDEVEILSSTKIYVKVTSVETGCFHVSSFQLIRLPLIEVTRLKNVEVCGSYILPALQEGERYFTQTKGQGTAYDPGAVYEVYGSSKLYVYRKGDNNCENETSFTLVVHEPIQADQIEDVVVSCENFILPQLSEGNRYFTAPNGGGVELHEGMEIMMPMTVYIYAKRGSASVYCADESSFSIAYEDCPLPKGISPNGDGLNDTFDLSGYGVSKIQIFNRHGLEVYTHGQGYTNQFAGQDKSGNKLPSGTYYYILIAHGKQRTGWLQLNY
ncbi:choice-of-anchor J domain-containing protein [Myroides sp. WP-1]|uniref:choice-of-anchor J domain-containing protein n=1 Tax=Myroides sp. WP-1 TaxID=2759944 RepID=UPI0015FD4113|nr:choice-of-anchor J domain-containing protein [Myroides sp. WP-1]MBB1140129.1 choice-of-anchor J domain-containing protein [Myroides sp. WP-1]